MNLSTTSLHELSKAVDSAWSKLSDSLFLEGEVPTQRQLEDLIIDLLPALNAFKQDHRIFGAWSPETLFLDSNNRTHLLPGYSMPLQKQYDPDSLFPGFAALEQYTDHPSYPLGSHTDIYGLAMILRTIILRVAPTSAIDRLNQDHEQISHKEIPGFSRVFLHSIDHASVLEFTQRIQTIQEWAQMLNLIGPAPGEMIDRLHAGYIHLLRQQRLLLEQHLSSQPQFSLPNNTQTQQARTYSASQALTFSTPYQLPRHTTLRVGRQKQVIKDISPIQTISEKEKEQADTQWSPQDKRSAATVSATGKNKTKGKAAKKAPPVTPCRRPSFAIPAMVASVLAAVTTIYVVFFNETSTPNVEAELTTTSVSSAHPTSTRQSSPQVTQASGSHVTDDPVLNSKHTEQQALAIALEQKRLREQVTAEQIERQRQALIRRQQEQTAFAAERAQAEEKQRQEKTLAEQRRREQEATRQREAEQRTIAEQRHRTQEKTRQREAEQRRREQELARTLSAIDSAPQRTRQAPPSPVTTPSRATTTVNIGTVRFNIRPWGNITINGANHGASPPLTNVRLAPGTYAVRVENGNFPAYSTSITVRAGQNATISHGFRR